MNYSSFVTTSNALEFFLVVTRKRLRVVNLYDCCFIQGDGSDNVDTEGEPKKKKEKKKKKKSGSKKDKTKNSDINSLDEEDNFAEMEFITNAIKATKAVKKSQNEKRKKRQK